MIYCVEDDDSIRELMLYTLKASGFQGRGFPEAAEFWQAIELAGTGREPVPRLIMLDIMLPGEDGISILQKLRANAVTARVPVIMATAKGTEYDKVKGLDLGADDYLAKPFGMMEMISRIKAVLRRSGPAGAAANEVKEGSYDKLTVNMTRYELKVDGKVVDAPPKELELLFHLASNPNRVFTRDQLLDEVWGFEYYGDSRTVDVHIKRLREKLEGVSDQWSLKTVWGVGYKFEVKE